MGRPSKYPRELREHAVRMVAEVHVRAGAGSAGIASDCSQFYPGFRDGHGFPATTRGST